MQKSQLLKMMKIFICLCFILPTSTSFAIDLFTPHASYPAIGPTTTGDFNGDGKIDLAVCNTYGRVVSILIGNGDGTFQAKMDYSVGGYPVEVATGDFDGDGKIDLVTANRLGWSGTVSILIGNGDATFQSRIDYRTGDSPVSVTVGDFNSDGKTDIATAHGVWWYSAASIFIGNGDGTFQTRKDYLTGYWPSSITMGDFNSDGKTDIATANSGDDSISILIGKGDGTFQSKVDYPTGDGPSSIHMSDFNGDGKADLSTANYFGGTVSIFIGNGDGTFQAREDFSTGYGGPRELALEDFNSDGKIDIAVANWGRAISILIGSGDGSFQLLESHPLGRYTLSISTGDFNGDDKPDLGVGVVYWDWSEGTSILLNRPLRASAGPDQTVECAGPSGALIALDGFGSSNPDGDPLTYTWTWNGGSAEGVNPTVQLPLGTTVVTLTVSDGRAAASDTVSITVQDTTPPVTTATGGNGDWYSTNVISTFTAYDSCSGVKEIHYIVNDSETVVPGGYATATLTNDGVSNISYFAVDNAGNAEAPKAMTVKIDKTPPTMSLNTNPGILWPPDHKMVDVLVGGDATDALSGLATVFFIVTDEYGMVQPSVSGFNTTIPLEAWREGTDKDGRKYTITAVATDVAGNKSVATTEVLVPHDQR